MQVLVPLFHVALLILLLKEDELLDLTSVWAILSRCCTCVEEINWHELLLFLLNLLNKFLLTTCLPNGLDFEVFEVQELFIWLRSRCQYLRRLAGHHPIALCFAGLIVEMPLVFQDNRGVLIRHRVIDCLECSDLCFQLGVDGVIVDGW